MIFKMDEEEVPYDPENLCVCLYKMYIAYREEDLKDKCRGCNGLDIDCELHTAIPF